MENQNTPLAILVILKAVEVFLLDIAPEGVTITRLQDAIRISGADVGTIREVKNLGARFLRNHSPNRSYRNLRIRGCKAWSVGSDRAVGIRIICTKEEIKSIVLGPVKGINY